AFPDGGEHWDPNAYPRVMIGGVPAVSPGQNWGWGYQILPFVEQTNLWQNSDNRLVRRTPVSIYFCPSRRAPMVFTAGVPIALLDYAGNAGTETDTGEPGAALGNGLNGLVVRRPGGSTGPSDIRSNQVRMDSSIPDGTSNTLLVGEKRLRPDKLGTPQLH